MAKPRTREEKAIAEGKARAQFERGVELLASWDEAWSFANGGPRQAAPGASHYTKLCYFLRLGISPDGADSGELAIYAALRARLGAFTPRGEGAR